MVYEATILSSIITFILTSFAFYIRILKINKHKKRIKFGRPGKSLPKAKKSGAMTDQVSVVGACEKDKKMLVEEINEATMEAALKEGAFETFLQPKYELQNERIVGAEALVRWMSGGKNFLYPDCFIPIFEKNGFIINLDLYMFEKVCKIIRSWREAGIEAVAVSVNFSKQHLLNEHFAQELGEIADAWKTPRNFLEIEITESMAMEDIGQMRRSFAALRKEGFSVALDDFGSGYSSLGFLKDMPIDTVKLDKTFFHKVENHQKFMTVIKHILLMAHELDLSVVAEGIETEAQINLLRQLDCDMVQGFYYDKPMRASAFEDKLRKQTKKIGVDYSAIHTVL